MPYGYPESHENSVLLFSIIGFLLTSAIILPLNAVDTNPLVSINASYNTSLLLQQIRITKYPGDNCSFKIETSKDLVIITDPCDMNEEVQIQIYGAVYQKLSPSQAFDITKQVQAKLVIPAHADPKNTDFLINWIKGPSEKVASGQLIVSKEELDKLLKTKVVSLDVFK